MNNSFIFIHTIQILRFKIKSFVDPDATVLVKVVFEVNQVFVRKVQQSNYDICNETCLFKKIIVAYFNYVRLIRPNYTSYTSER
jgi:hypothetical protein